MVYPAFILHQMWVSLLEQWMKGKCHKNTELSFCIRIYRSYRAGTIFDAWTSFTQCSLSRDEMSVQAGMAIEGIWTFWREGRLNIVTTALQLSEGAVRARETVAGAVVESFAGRNVEAVIRSDFVIRTCLRITMEATPQCTGLPAAFGRQTSEDCRCPPLLGQRQADHQVLGGSSRRSRDVCYAATGFQLCEDLGKESRFGVYPQHRPTKHIKN